MKQTCLREDEVYSLHETSFLVPQKVKAVYPTAEIFPVSLYKITL